MNALLPMSPSQATALLTVLFVVTFRVSAAYLVAWWIARLATSASVRFAVWLIFLTSASAYWACSLGRLMTGALEQQLAYASLSGAPGSAPIPISPGSTHTLVITMQIAIGVYACVLGWLALSGGWKRVQLARALRFRISPSEPVCELFQEVSGHLNAPACRLWLLPGLPSPASSGWLRPAIYLPADEGAAVTPQLRDVLWHELSHVRRRDGLWEGLSRVCRCLLFFHPLVHRAAGALRLERELACDLNVVRQNPDGRHQYADTLVHFGWKTTLASRPDHLGVGFISQSAVLNTRVRAILRGEEKYSRWSKGLRAALSTGACWLLVAILPPLWVGFAIRSGSSAASVDPVVAEHVVSSVSLHGRRHALRLPKPFGSAAHSVTASNSSTLPETPLATKATRPPHYVLMPSADAPLSDSVAVQDSRGSSGGGGASTSGIPGQPTRPSTTSVVVDAAEQLGRLGMGRRDHDHD